MGVKRREACRNTSFFEFSLCLSRACLGRNIAFIYKWLEKTVFSPLSRALKSNAVAPARAANVPAENAHLFLSFSYVRPDCLGQMVIWSIKWRKRYMLFSHRASRICAQARWRSCLVALQGARRHSQSSRRECHIQTECREKTPFFGGFLLTLPRACLGKLSFPSWSSSKVKENGVCHT